MERGPQYILSFEFPDPYFVHPVVFLQDFMDAPVGEVSTADLDKYHATSWEVFVGNDPDHLNNTKCAGGPHLRPDYEDKFDEFKGRFVPSFTVEAWCNLKGRYVHLVASNVPSESVTICTVGILGTRYVRNQALEP